MSDLDSTITREILATQITCFPETGEIRWAKPRRGRPTHGTAGTVDKNGYWRLNLTNAFPPSADGSKPCRMVLGHRLMWFWVHGVWPPEMIDHINGNTSDNRIENLRAVSNAVNLQNRRKASAVNKLGFLGVHFARGRYRASLGVDGKTMNLGRFKTPEEAQEAYLAAKRRHHEGCTL